MGLKSHTVAAAPGKEGNHTNSDPQQGASAICLSFCGRQKPEMAPKIPECWCVHTSSHLIKH